MTPSAPWTATLSLHDALPISVGRCQPRGGERRSPARPWVRSRFRVPGTGPMGVPVNGVRSEEHTSELQSLTNLVCRLLLEKKKIYLLELYSKMKSTF